MFECKSKSKQSAFHGWWLHVSKAPFLGLPNIYPENNLTSSQVPIYLFIDTSEHDKCLCPCYHKNSENGKIKVYAFAGNVCRQREPITGIDGLILLDESENWQLTNNDTVLRLVDTFGGYEFGYFNDSALTLQSSGSLEGYAVWSDTEATNSLGGFVTQNAVLQKIAGFDRLDKPPTPIRPYEKDDALFVNPNDRITMFKQLIETFAKVAYAPTATESNPEDYVGRERQLEVEQQLLTTGIQRPEVCIIDIKKTTNLENPSTTILTQEYHGLNPAAKVVVSGLTGEWAVLNGEHSIVVNDLSQYDPANSPKGENYINLDTFRYRFVVRVDTSGVNETFSKDSQPNAHAQAVRYGPVTSTIEYRDWLTCVWEYFNQVFNGTSVHSGIIQAHDRFAYVLDPDTFDAVGIPTGVVETWDDLKKILLSDVFALQGEFAGFSSGGSGAPFFMRVLGSRGSMFYNNAFTQFGQCDFFCDPFNISLGIFPLNEAFTDLNAFEVPGDYSIPKNNYLDQSATRYAWWRINPNTPVTLKAHKCTKLLFDPDCVRTIGLNYEGSRFQGFIFDKSPNDVFVNGETPPTAPDGGALSPFNTSFGGFLPDRHYFGLINPDFTEGKRIGYWRIADMYSLIDPFGIQFSPMFGSSDSPLRSYEAGLAVVTPIMKYLNTILKVEHIILDIRGNQGGLNRGWIHLFGGDREGPVQNTGFANREERALVRSTEMSWWGGYAETETQAANRQIQSGEVLTKLTGLSQLLPSEVKKLFGNDAVFEGEGRKVLILTDIVALSAGEEVLHFFAGNNGDGDIGGGVQSLLVGDVDGRLMGFSGGPENGLDLSMFSSEFRDITGQAVPVSYLSTEAPCLQDRNGLFDSTRVNISFISPVGGPLNNEFEDTVYYDFGQTVPHANPISEPLPNYPNNGQPIKYVPETYRDQWLEKAIRTLCPDIGTSEIASPEQVTAASVAVSEGTPVSSRGDKINELYKKKKDLKKTNFGYLFETESREAELKGQSLTPAQARSLRKKFDAARET